MGEEKSKKKKPKSFLRKVLAFFVPGVIFVMLGVGVFGYWVQDYFHSPGPLSEDAVIDIPAGSGVAQITHLLHDRQIIENPFAFKVALRLHKLDKSLKAGEFLFKAKSSPSDAARVMIEGKTVLHSLTVPEGLTSFEIVQLVNNAPKLDGLIVQIPPEGSLLPETYSFAKGAGRIAIISKMQRHMEDTLDELWAARQDGLPFKSKEEALILASIVEKETGLDGERGKVAGVFVNRLRKGMRLQSDPTVIYGITLGEKDMGRPISRTDLRTKTAYNTYAIDRLPPSPICNPGRESLEAVLNPEQTDALYFVADGTGGHAFARTLAEHNRNVAQWRRIERERKK